MRLTGFCKAPLVIKLEEDIAEIAITDEDTTIKGRIDILAIKKHSLRLRLPFGIWSSKQKIAKLLP
jgi:hypothetical protein